MGCLCRILSPKVQSSMEKMVGARGCGWLQENSIFQIQEGSCTYKLTVIMIAGRKSVKDQARQNPSMEGEGGM